MPENASRAQTRAQELAKPSKTFSSNDSRTSTATRAPIWQPSLSSAFPDALRLHPANKKHATRTQTTGPTCDFVYTGYRVPLIVVSPYARQNYVSHTVADTTAILRLVETRFDLPTLTNRDAAQEHMTEFFDFDNPVWLTPPAPPAQATNGACYLNKLP